MKAVRDRRGARKIPEAGAPTSPAGGPGKRKNVFLIGLNPFNRAKLETVTHARQLEFHGLLEEPHHYDVPGMLAQADRELRGFPGSIDAVVGYVDFPISTMLPILCARFGLRTPSLESVLKCEHKYWARLEQKKVVPRCIPRFVTFDPFDDDALAKIRLPFPFWIKPIKSSGSYLGFRVSSERDFRHAVPKIRAGIAKLAKPFNFVLKRATLPPEVARVDGYKCMAEQLVSGRQCTLEGYVFEGKVDYHGVVDSIREPNHSSFARYEYPSRLPRRVRNRMAKIGTKVLTRIGFDNSGFNMEFFWDPRRQRIWLLEINTRVAQHHSDLFQKVDGTTNHEVPIQIALANRPNIPHREGPFHRAAAFFIRAHRDAVVAETPSPGHIQTMERRFPGTIVQLQVKPGMRLSELHEQDSYSYILAIVYMGASSQKQLLANWRECARALRFHLEP